MTPAIRTAVALAAAVPFLLVGTGPASAGRLPASASHTATAHASQDPAPSGFSLAVSPTRLVVERGQAGRRQQVKVVNGGTSTMRVDVTKQSFSGGRDGSLVMDATAPYSAATWVDVSPTTLRIPAGETRIVTARIRIPADPEPGDHQVALVFLVPAGQTRANVRINRGIGTPVYITVPGPIDDSARVEALDAGGFTAGGPVDITATVRNTGTVHRDFRADTPLRVDVAGQAAPFPDFTVMRGATRDIATTWDPPLACVCHPTVSVTDAEGGVQSMSVRVIVFPWPLVLIIVAVLLLLAAAYRLARRRYDRNVARAAAALRPLGGSGRG